MSKTTIDGLAVRSSGKRSSLESHKDGRSTRHTARAESSSATNADPLILKSGHARTEAAQLEDTWNKLDNDDNSQSLDGGSEFIDNTAESWSDLLSQMQDNSRDGGLVTDGDDCFAEESEYSSVVEFEDKNRMNEWSDQDLDILAEGFGCNRKDIDPKQKTSKKHKKHLVRNIIILSILFLIIGSLIAIFVWGDSLISRLTGGRSGFWDTISAFVSNEVPFETDENGRTNVLVFGTEGYNMDGDTANGTHDGAQLTDSIMVISFDQKTKDVALISLPRDLKVTAACSAGKINEVFWCANQDGKDDAAGAQALMEQVGEILGLDFQYYAHVNWGSLVDIVDAIGGITVTLDEDINDYAYTGAVVQAGVPTYVNGEQALGLARARHGTAGGDFTRGNTQQKIISAIVEKIINNGVTITDALNLLNILGDNLRSNFSAENIKSGVKVLTGFNMDNVRQLPLIDYDNGVYYVTTATINDLSYVVPSAGVNNYDDIQAYISQSLSSDPIIREGAEVVVYNGTDAYGVAGAEKAELEMLGVEVTNIGDVDNGVCEVPYCVYSIQNMPATANMLRERYGVEIMDGELLPVDVWDGGADFVIIIGPSL